jgi:hypothetical protein
LPLVSCLVVASSSCYALCYFELLLHYFVLLFQSSTYCFVTLPHRPTWSCCFIIILLQPHHVTSSLRPCVVSLHCFMRCLVASLHYLIASSCCLVMLFHSFVSLLRCATFSLECNVSLPPRTTFLLHRVAFLPCYLALLLHFTTFLFWGTFWSPHNLLFCYLIILLPRCLVLVGISLLPPLLQGRAWSLESKFSNNHQYFFFKFDKFFYFLFLLVIYLLMCRISINQKKILTNIIIIHFYNLNERKMTNYIIIWLVELSYITLSPTTFFRNFY